MDIELLISEVFACPSLWCAKDPKHSDRHHIANQWEKIGGKVGVTGQFLITNVIKIIFNIAYIRGQLSC